MQLSNAIKELPSKLFRGCSNLDGVTIPNSVMEIKDDVFRDCASLSAITIPVSVKKMGNDVFKNCPSLQEITMRSAAPPKISSDTFDKDVLRSATLYVPSTSPYQGEKEKRWTKFSNMVKIKN